MAGANSPDTAFGEITPRFPQGDFRPTTPPAEELPNVRVARLTGQSLPICLVFRGYGLRRQSW